MKRLIYLLITVFSLVACQPKDNNGNGGNQQATTPLELSCINGTSYCNNQAYANYYGWMPYPGLYNYAYNYNNTFLQQGFCGCPSGYAPTYNGSYGLGCVREHLLQPFAGYFFYWSYGYGYTYDYAQPAPQTTINIAQYSNIPDTYNSYSSCSQTLTQSCIMSQGNTCGAGATCREAIAGSNLGVCVRN